MPKLIKEAREHILEAADRELAEKGYENLTIRGIASECGLAVGTVYNYFHAKDEIVFFMMHRDWDGTMARIKSIANEHRAAGTSGDGAVDKDAATKALLRILKHLHAFVSKHKGTWRLIAASPREAASETVRSYDRSGFMHALEAEVARILEAGGASLQRGEGIPGAATDDPTFLARFVTAAFTRFAMDDSLDEARMRQVLKNLV